MLWEWTWTGRDILRQVGRFGRSSRWTFALPQPQGTPQTLLAQGQDRGRGGLREGRSVRPPARNLSSPLCSGSGSRVWGGPEVEAVGGVGGAQGRGAGGGFLALGGQSVVTGPTVWSWRGSAQLDGARRRRTNAARTRAPAAGPMASSCASIDIEDATQHLRDILKLDRPAGGEPERWGWVLGERAEGRCGPRPPSWPSGHSGPALHPPGW